MYDTVKVIAGLAVFFLFFTSPIWYNRVSGKGPKMEELDLGPAKAISEKCVEDTEWMRDNHMQLLDDWRDLVVRENKRLYKATDGEQFEMSLTETCLKCHSNYTTFCKRCHDYNVEDPFCWDCHMNETEESR